MKLNIVALMLFFKIASNANMDHWPNLVRRYETDEFILGYSFLVPIRKYLHYPLIRNWFQGVTSKIRSFFLSKSVFDRQSSNYLLIDWNPISQLLPAEKCELLKWQSQMHLAIVFSPFFNPHMLPRGQFSDFDNGPGVLFRLAELEVIEPHMLQLMPNLLEYHLKSIETLIHFRVVPLGSNSAKFLYEQLSFRLNQLAAKSFTFTISGPVCKFKNIEVFDRQYLLPAKMFGQASGPIVPNFELCNLSLADTSHPRILKELSLEDFNLISSRVRLLIAQFGHLLDIGSKHKLWHPVYEMSLQYYYDTFSGGFCKEKSGLPKVDSEILHFDPREDVFCSKLAYESLLAEPDVYNRLQHSIRLKTIQYDLLRNLYHDDYPLILFLPILTHNSLVFLKAWKSVIMRGWGYLLDLISSGDYQSCLYNLVEIMRIEGKSADVGHVLDYFSILIDGREGLELRMIRECLRILKS